MKTDTVRKHDSYLHTQRQHDLGVDPDIIKGHIGLTYAGAFVIWSILKEGWWTACIRKPRIKETQATMELV